MPHLPDNAERSPSRPDPEGKKDRLPTREPAPGRIAITGSRLSPRTYQPDLDWVVEQMIGEYTTNPHTGVGKRK